MVGCCCWKQKVSMKTYLLNRVMLTKKQTIENREFEYIHNLNEGNKSQNQNTSLLETEFSMVNSKKLWRSLQSLNIVNILMKETNLSVLLVGSEDFSGRGIILRDDLEEVVEKNAEFENSDNLKKLIKSLCSTSLL